jgi:hypothetical protein
MCKDKTYNFLQTRDCASDNNRTHSFFKEGELNRGVSSTVKNENVRKLKI